MPIVDAQVHVWVNPPVAESPLWPHRRIESFTWQDLSREMAEAGVDRALLVPMGAGGADHAREGAQCYPDRFAVLGALPIDKGGAADPLAGLRRSDGFIALRAAFNTPRALAALANRTADRAFAAAEAEDVPIASFLIPGASARVANIAQRFPRLRLAIAHLACPRADAGIKDAAAFAHLPELLALARFPQVAIVASGLSGYTSDPYPYAGLDPILHQVFDAFGAERMFWGSDLTRLRDPYRRCVTHFSETLSWLTGTERELVMGRALNSWLGWAA